ncbi:chromosome segregation protein SMC [Aidingimonas halophila]|uniref:Chromosome partition protein Smc n=1 Tax=Aidingimonas halophila TaxID=574349 RepID=A0A1H2V7V1_9GAMM|nr:chromosome segregation protein SMC [Aidingimonas halophila]GHC23920.1 chromosome partition protein Smc [Aidingimonas halophila]SDW64407.1 condensin subunit Smc [Aidingimonas halophila]
MRLKSIKLVGFKSFVDPVTVPFDGNMTAIVGPNGCGKSNIIDAVRWVMGESSAKTLRGEAMTDVIFNGSTARKPVGQASIELHFDNRDGSMGGPYAQYAEIAVKRQVTRDSQSTYFFNGQKCRRRDIADLFLGTGLGPRSYSIIGQGMISRLIEARPEELRATLEEAAGISRYKERRRETENRMRRTQENLERLDDIREELDKQLERLERQAEAARRYQTLQQQQHRLKGELALLRARGLRTEQQEQEQRIREQETAIERELLGQRQCETRLEQARSEHDKLAEELEGHQARFYETTTAITRIEQELAHARTRESQLASDLESAQRELAELDELSAADAERLAEVDERLAELAPDQEAAAEALAQLESELEAAETRHVDVVERWEALNESHRQAGHEAERAQDRVRHLEQALEELTAEEQRRRQQYGDLPDVETLRAQREELAGQLSEAEVACESVEQRRRELQQQRTTLQERITDAEQSRESQRQVRSRLQGELASLEALIEAGLADNDSALETLLANRGLDTTPRLGECLDVDPEWEDAVSWVLSPWIGARVVSEDRWRDTLEALDSGELPLLAENVGETSSPADHLAAHVRGNDAACSLLLGIRCVATHDDAWQQRAVLNPGESVITADGLWLGRDWVRRRCSTETKDSLLASRRRRDEVAEELATLDARLQEQDHHLEAAREQLRECEMALEQCHQASLEHDQQRQQLQLREGNLATRLDHLASRARELDDEFERLAEQRESRRAELEEARNQWQSVMASLDDTTHQRQVTDEERRGAQEHLDALRDRHRTLSERSQQLALDHQRLTTERSGLVQQMQRAEQSRARLEEKHEALQAQREQLNEPGEDNRERLEELLEQREQNERALNDCRDRIAALAEQLREDEQSRHRHEQELERLRERLQESRLQVQALALKADTQDEHLAELGHDAEELARKMAAEATESAWQSRLDDVSDRIRRLGAINLAAIEEYDQQAERRDYLEAQHAELSEALETLERAIRKIDQETRTRFKQTFDRVNTGLGELFPKVFGGGTAWLTLTDDDLLETGVAIMARPPGKKNTSIHLLSGGEKALTALSLVFAIFHLNPAPFCLLDEVDAPLDDVNVGRYANLVKEMSESVQFIYITHNKIAMESAERLMGVTMQEPGVSRMVSVGIEEAAEFAEA